MNQHYNLSQIKSTNEKYPDFIVIGWSATEPEGLDFYRQLVSSKDYSIVSTSFSVNNYSHFAYVHVIRK